MYNAGDAYRAAIMAQTRESKINITITTVDGAEYTINDAGVIKDTVYLKNQAINGSSLSFGAVYAAEFGAVIMCTADRYSLYDAKVVVKFSIKTGTTWTDVNIGTYYITEANRIGSKISIKALDAMMFLDEEITLDSVGTAYQLLNAVSEKTGVQLAQTQAQINALPNAADIQYTVYAGRVETLRDLVACLAALTGTFATINRNGKLELRKFSGTSNLTVAQGQRKYGGSVSDYKSKITKVTMRFIAQENYYPYTAKDTPNDGLELDLGDIPIVYGLPAVKNQIVQNILDVCGGLTYTPAQFEVMGDPCIELGDRITLTNTNHSTVSVETLVTSFCWNYRKLETVTGAGDNPRLMHAKSKSDRAFSAVSGDAQQAEMYVAGYENAAEVTLTQEFQEVITLKFATSGEANVLFNATLIFSVDSDTTTSEEVTNADGTTTTVTTVTHNPQNISFLYKLNGEDITPYTPIQTVIHGYAIITLHYPLLKLETNKAYDFRVYAKTTGGTIKADVGAIKATVSGSNMTGGLNTWDGTIELDDAYTVVGNTLNSSLRALMHNLDVDIKAVSNSKTISDEVPAVSSGMAVSVGTLTDVLSIGTKEDNKNVNMYNRNSRYITDENAVRTEWKYDAVEQTIDSGKTIKIDIKNDDVTVTDIEVTVE